MPPMPPCRLHRRCCHLRCVVPAVPGSCSLRPDAPLHSLLPPHALTAGQKRCAAGTSTTGRLVFNTNVHGLEGAAGRAAFGALLQLLRTDPSVVFPVGKVRGVQDQICSLLRGAGCCVGGEAGATPAHMPRCVETPALQFGRMHLEGGSDLRLVPNELFKSACEGEWCQRQSCGLPALVSLGQTRRALLAWANLHPHLRCCSHYSGQPPGADLGDGLGAHHRPSHCDGCGRDSIQRGVCAAPAHSALHCCAGPSGCLAAGILHSQPDAASNCCCSCRCSGSSPPSLPTGRQSPSPPPARTSASSGSRPTRSVSGCAMPR